jgi:hypothetical protein
MLRRPCICVGDMMTSSPKLERLSPSWSVFTALATSLSYLDQDFSSRVDANRYPWSRLLSEAWCPWRLFRLNILFNLTSWRLLAAPENVPALAFHWRFVRTSPDHSCIGLHRAYHCRPVTHCHGIADLGRHLGSSYPRSFNWWKVSKSSVQYAEVKTYLDTVTPYPVYPGFCSAPLIS